MAQGYIGGWTLGLREVEALERGQGNPGHTFSSFVVTNQNRRSYEAAREVRRRGEQNINFILYSPAKLSTAFKL